MTISDVHTCHCCKVCGCKYGNDDCTVTNNIAPAEYDCMDCKDTLGWVTREATALGFKLVPINAGPKD